MKKIFLLFAFNLIIVLAFCQDPTSVLRDRFGGLTRGQNNNSNKKSSDTSKKNGNNKLDTLGFERRDDLADSINVSFRYMDSLRRQPLDSSVNDFDKYYSVPSSYQYLGNNGAAAFPLIFKPYARPGWDAGFHAFDVYKFTLENTKFYKVTGPFSMLAYQLAGGQEQMLQAMHTQSPKPNINVGFEYKFINAPGFFKNQNTNHNNVRFFGTYTGKRKRYNGSFVIISNNIKASENGGIVSDSLLLDKNKSSRFAIPVNLGNMLGQTPNPFQSNVKTGNVYKESTFFLKQSYDLGKRDSIAINDTTTEYLFYPKLRIQHTITLNTYNYNFTDVVVDSSFYKNYYDTIIPKRIVADTFSLNEKWKTVSNDFSLIQFPDTKNTAQFFMAGITLQNLQANNSTGDYSFYNIALHGEYRNRTRNKLWDLMLKGELYANGFSSGDYSANASVSRFINKKFGVVDAYFSNVNRTPSFIFDNRSSFNLGNINNFNKENIISFGATSNNAILKIGFNNFLITNYVYFKTFKKTDQYSKPINLFQIFASKKIKLKKNIFYYADATLQQTDGAAPIKVPLLFTRSRIAYEGSIYKNLKISAGLEVRYYTPYKANNYSPILGQFVPQDTFVVKNKPDIAAFFHFRIRSFSTYIRAENLNTASFANGFGFIDNNFAAPHYPTQGFVIRFGIKWWFVK